MCCKFSLPMPRYLCINTSHILGFPGGTSGSKPAYQCSRHKRHGLIPESGRSPGGGHGNPLQYSCLENPMKRGAWCATVRRVWQSRRWPKWLSRHTHTHKLPFVESQSSFVVVVQSLSRPTVRNPMDCSPPGSSVLHCLPEFAQVHVCWVGDAIQPSHPLSSPSPAFNRSRISVFFQWVGSSHQVAKVLELQPQSFPVNIRGWFPELNVGLNSDQDEMCSPFNLLAFSEINVHPAQALLFLDSCAPVITLRAVKSTHIGRQCVLQGPQVAWVAVRYTLGVSGFLSGFVSQLFNQSSTDDNSVGKQTFFF